ncbi:MAG: UbiX family flavin prenyltransferase [Alphaproteobacteria bacterium]|jgi:4-hydroxy-3-polyprenylbenzoate decarboxylase|tara:strand:- start:354 stop:941 length:588 start_codon:yes stop_codon:yes gene_type:complete
MKRLIVGITGATGVIFGVRLLETLADSGIETHLVVSKWAQQTLGHETTMTMAELNGLATVNYAPGDMGAAISSGSFHTDGMVIVPCSVRSLAAVAHGMGDHLVHRAADVVLKERRKLVLVARETPLNEIHLNNMLMLARMGAVILPPVPAFYNHPESLDDMVDHIVMRILDQFDMPKELMARWDGKLRSRASNTQ